MICRNVAGVLFDMHGTLVYESPDVPAQWEMMARRLDRPLERFKAAFMKGSRPLMAGEISAEDRYRQVLTDLELNSDPDEVRRLGRMEMEIRGSAATLYPGVVSLLEGLRARGLKLGLVTNCTPLWEPLIGHLGLKAMLDLLVLSCRVKLAKPEPGIFLRALESLGLNAREALYVGDGGDDELRAAADLGMVSVYLDQEPKMRSEGEPVGYHHRVTHFSEIEHLAKGGGQ